VAGQNVVAVVALLDTLPPPSVDKVDRLYCQLVDILAVVAAQQVDCARLRLARDSTSNLVYSRVNW
jgi:hypothetical protein